MGLGTGLAFIAIGAILAFATHFTLNGIDVQTIGWILMLVGVASIAFTMLYVRPRRRGTVTEVIGEVPGYDVRPDEPLAPHVYVDQSVQQPEQPGQPTVHLGRPAPHVRRRGPQDLP
jgi:hypothetical protein